MIHTEARVALTRALHRHQWIRTLHLRRTSRPNPNPLHRQLSRPEPVPAQPKPPSLPTCASLKHLVLILRPQHHLRAAPPQGQERRRSIRYKCEGSAQFRVEGSEVRTWRAWQDISLHGCYVEATAVSPVGTILHLLVEVNKIRVHAKGEVRVSYAFVGMGIAFIEIAEEERAHLRELLRSLSEAHALHQDPNNTAVTREQQPAPLWLPTPLLP